MVSDLHVILHIGNGRREYGHSAIGLHDVPPGQIRKISEIDSSVEELISVDQHGEGKIKSLASIPTADNKKTATIAKNFSLTVRVFIALDEEFSSCLPQIIKNFETKRTQSEEASHNTKVRFLLVKTLFTVSTNTLSSLNFFVDDFVVFTHFLNFSKKANVVFLL